MISFNQVPNNLRVPFAFIEFDASGARRGASIQPFKILVMGQKLSTGTIAELTKKRVTSAAQAANYFGAGSMIHGMCETLFANNKTTEVQVIAVDDVAAGSAAAGSIAFEGPASANGTIFLYIAGRLVKVAVENGDTAAEIATATAAAITAAAAGLPVTAAVDGSIPTKVNITAKHKGTVGNGIDLRVNYQDGQELPAGVAATITAMASGATDPDVAEIITAMGEDQFNVIVNPWLDADNLTKLEAELADRFGPIRQSDGMAISAKKDTHANLGTFGNTRNTPHVSTMGCAGPTPAYEWAAAIAAVVALHGQIDPARPFQTLPLKNIQPPTESERFTMTERNLLLYDGISTFKVDAGGNVGIERLITMYRQNALGADDTAYLDVNTVFTLSYLRYDFRNYFLSKYPRHKLANDGGRYAAGQAIMTPSLGRAEAIAKFRQWEEMGLVENIDQFKNDLIVERNAQDPNRLDFLMPPDLVNSLVVTGVKIAFLL